MYPALVTYLTHFSALNELFLNYDLLEGCYFQPLHELGYFCMLCDSMDTWLVLFKVTVMFD
eukprot:snap_masked-scaffold_8-processed-gene-1.24-mRNA-1 protein AED:1.00 eAED:1.00 QI:0/0/0/0/1/1/3/0/60